MNVVLIISIFTAGILSFFSPCVFPLLPVYLGILLDEREERKIRLPGFELPWYSLLKTLIFVAGTSFIFAILGFGAGWFGRLLNHRGLRIGLGILVIIMGLHQTEIIHIKSLYKSRQLHFQQLSDRGQLLKPLLLGVSLSLGWSPCVGPVLGSVLALAASGGNGSLIGAGYMLIYSLGFSLPFLAIALSSTLILKRMQQLKKHMQLMKRAGGLLIIAMGLLLIFGNINVLSTLIE